MHRRSGNVKPTSHNTAKVPCRSRHQRTKTKDLPDVKTKVGSDLPSMLEALDWSLALRKSGTVARARHPRRTEVHGHPQLHAEFTFKGSGLH